MILAAALVFPSLFTFSVFFITPSSISNDGSFWGHMHELETSGTGLGSFRSTFALYCFAPFIAVISYFVSLAVGSNLSRPAASLVPGFRSPVLSIPLAFCLLIVFYYSLLLWGIGCSLLGSLSLLLLISALSQRPRLHIYISWIIILCFFTPYIERKLPFNTGFLNFINGIINLENYTPVFLILFISLTLICHWVIKMSRSKEESLAYYVKQAAVFSRNPRLYRYPNINFAQRILLRPFRFTGEYVGKGLISQTLLLRAGNFLLSPWKIRYYSLLR